MAFSYFPPVLEEEPKEPEARRSQRSQKEPEAASKPPEEPLGHLTGRQDT